MFYRIHYILRNRMDVARCTETDLRQVITSLTACNAQIISIRDEYGKRIHIELT